MARVVLREGGMVFSFVLLEKMSPDVLERFVMGVEEDVMDAVECALDFILALNGLCAQATS